MFTFAAWTSHSFLTASLIWRLFALISTRNTRVLCSSIFFIADSVFRGLPVSRKISYKNGGALDEIRTKRWCDIDPCEACAVYSCADIWDLVASAKSLVGGTTRSCASCGQSASAHPGARLSLQSWPLSPISRLFRHYSVAIYQGIRLKGECTLRSCNLAFRVLCGGHFESSE